jgi:hypothetical protein
VERIGVGEETESPFSLQGEDDPGNFLIFYKDVVPNRKECLKGNREVKVLFYQLEKFWRGYFSHIKVIDDPLYGIEEIGKDCFGISKFFFLRESREFFCNLIMVERKDDIAEIEKDHIDGRLGHFLPHPCLPAGRPTLSLGGCVALAGKGQASSFKSFRIAVLLEVWLTTLIIGRDVFMEYKRMNLNY